MFLGLKKLRSIFYAFTTRHKMSMNIVHKRERKSFSLIIKKVEVGRTSKV
jgi:hypothetical protein